MPEQLDRNRIAEIQAELRNLDSIIDLQLDGAILKIEYTFPAIGFSTIWQLVKKHTGSTPFGLTANLAYTLRAYTEGIEQQHLLSQCGWDIYVLDIFVASYQKDSARRAGQRRKPGQQIKRLENAQIDPPDIPR